MSDQVGQACTSMMRYGRTLRTTLVSLAVAVSACSSGDGGSGGLPTVASASSSATVPQSSPASTTALTTSTSTSTSTTAAPTTTTTIPLVVDGAIVLVANAADVPGAAGLLSQQLRGVGFAVAEPTNAAGNERQLDASKVYYLPAGYDAALSIGAAMGDLEVLPMPTPAWIVGATDALGDANVLVMLGKDLAGQEIPALVARS